MAPTRGCERPAPVSAVSPAARGAVTRPDMDLELTDKVAVVTGASKGIGLAVVRTLVDEGARVVAGARSIDALGGMERVTPFAVDLTSKDGPTRLVHRALEAHGRVDVLVNNVG